FRCSKYDKQCHSYLLVNESDEIVFASEHRDNCYPDDKIESLVAFKNQLKQLSMDTGDVPSKIISTALANLENQAGQISTRSYESDRQIVNRYRSAHKTPAPKDPESRILIPVDFFQGFSLSSRGEQFLLHDDGPER